MQLHIIKTNPLHYNNGGSSGYKTGVDASFKAEVIAAEDVMAE